MPWQGEERDALQASASALIVAEPISAGRVNEVGFTVEKLLREALAEQGFTVDTPETQSGRRQSAGYPDMAARKDGRTFYIEVKSFSAKTADSTQRSFYLSPSDDPKITEDAHHLLFGVEMEALPNDEYRIARVELLDLTKLQCELKIEFNASNRDLYDGELTILQAP